MTLPTSLFMAIAIGLVVGSFLNMLIHRLPIMLEGVSVEGVEGRFDLAWPPSHCPQCEARLAWRENIPLLSWLVQGGRCRHCQQPIAWRYPLVELAAAGLAVLAVLLPLPGLIWPWHVLLLWGLLALTVIDLQTRLLPDMLTLSLLWMGLLLNLHGAIVPLVDAVIGAVSGYGTLWLIRTVHMQLRGVEGLGLGDAKLLAALGAWLGWMNLPLVLLLASTVGAVVGISLIAAQRGGWQMQLPFGPWLALGGVLALFWGDAWLRLMV